MKGQETQASDDFGYFLMGQLDNTSSRFLPTCFTRRDEIMDRNLLFGLKDELAYKVFITTIKSCHNPFHIRHKKQDWANDFIGTQKEEEQAEELQEESVLDLDLIKEQNKRNGGCRGADESEEKEYFEHNRRLVKGW